MSLPFEITALKWDSLPAEKRMFFCARDEESLPEIDRQRIARLTSASAAELADWLLSRLPLGHDCLMFPDTATLYLNEDSWGTEAGRAAVRDWLHRRGVPYAREVYLLYERDCIVVLPWKILLRYWDSFAWTVGYDMVATDDTASWACLFHHEAFIQFGAWSQRPQDT